MTTSERQSAAPPAATAPAEGIVPDTKDWTWVLERPCPDCGLDSGAVARTAVPGLIRANAEAWAAVLAGDEAELRRRPAPDTWSDLEYACHVRDVFRLFRFRLDLMLDQDGPDFPNWDQDATAVAERYGEQEPKTVAADLTEAAQVLADAFERVEGAQWLRTGNRSDGARFTVESFSRYLVHDPGHHLYDVTGERA
ncbi:DinB family protein [Kitasatospora sp. A2-31]|uniref:DinB family protein n=1 Tax=Kitasatospora sp. A2-31 TaxID=2916414 RepID=UPI001EEA124A|nr:DinB family protein [Kitasatospora sp. A2-31]MCG6496313.1 DinB family protein [Kitasatospora sp. A2-31]